MSKFRSELKSLFAKTSKMLFDVRPLITSVYHTFSSEISHLVHPKLAQPLEGKDRLKFTQQDKAIELQVHGYL